MEVNIYFSPSQIQGAAIVLTTLLLHSYVVKGSPILLPHYLHIKPSPPHTKELCLRIL